MIRRRVQHESRAFPVRNGARANSAADFAGPFAPGLPQSAGKPAIKAATRGQSASLAMRVSGNFSPLI
jgi:hypothetical protein